MLYDERHPQLSFVFLTIREALERHATRIVLRRGDGTFAVSYEIDGELIARDDINNRHWHHTLGAFHLLVGETDFQHPDRPDDFTGPDSEDARTDEILIDDRFPPLNNTQLNHLRAEAALPIILAVAFGANQVLVTFKREPRKANLVGE